MWYETVCPSVKEKSGLLPTLGKNVTVDAMKKPVIYMQSILKYLTWNGVTIYNILREMEVISWKWFQLWECIEVL